MEKQTVRDVAQICNQKVPFQMDIIPEIGVVKFVGQGVSGKLIKAKSKCNFHHNDVFDSVFGINLAANRFALKVLKDARYQFVGAAKRLMSEHDNLQAQIKEINKQIRKTQNDIKHTLKKEEEKEKTPPN